MRIRANIGGSGKLIKHEYAFGRPPQMMDERMGRGPRGRKPASHVPPKAAMFCKERSCFRQH